jgi:hypothetical protein
MSKTCRDCIHFNGVAYCSFRRACTWGRNEACGDFEDKNKQTVFHRITSSPEVLAENLVYSIKIISGCEIMYSSNVLDVCYDTKEKAIRATVAKLKEVEK